MPEAPDNEHVFISFKPNPSAKAYPVLPRYLMRLGEATAYDTIFSSFLETRRIYLDPGQEEIVIGTNMVAPFGF